MIITAKEARTIVDTVNSPMYEEALRVVLEGILSACNRGEVELEITPLLKSKGVKRVVRLKVYTLLNDLGYRLQGIRMVTQPDSIRIKW